MPDYTRKMLSEIRNRMTECNKIELPGQDNTINNENIYDKHTIVSEQLIKEDQNQKAMVINDKDIQFGSVKASQEDAIRKTIGDVTFKEDALKYYPKSYDPNSNTTVSENLVINGEIRGLGVTFQFKYIDRSGDGCYIWAEGLQLTEANLRVVEKIRDAFQNWEKSLTDDGDLFQKLEKEASKQE